MGLTSRYIIYTTHGPPPKQSLKPTMTATMLNFSLGMAVLPSLICVLAYDISVTPQNQGDMKQAIDLFNCVEDCPIFADMYDFCKMYTGASLAAARKLCAGTTDIAINWSGGLHHAKKAEASGFCYVNDIVLAILELLRQVLYHVVPMSRGEMLGAKIRTSPRHPLSHLYGRRMSGTSGPFFLTCSELRRELT